MASGRGEDDRWEAPSEYRQPFSARLEKDKHGLQWKQVASETGTLDQQTDTVVYHGQWCKGKARQGDAMRCGARSWTVAEARSLSSLPSQPASWVRGKCGDRSEAAEAWIETTHTPFGLAAIPTVTLRCRVQCESKSYGLSLRCRRIKKSRPEHCRLCVYALLRLSSVLFSLHL